MEEMSIFTFSCASALAVLSDITSFSFSLCISACMQRDDIRNNAKANEFSIFEMSSFSVNADENESIRILVYQRRSLAKTEKETMFLDETQEVLKREELKETGFKEFVGNEIPAAAFSLQAIA
jgi:hypothetical protein